MTNDLLALISKQLNIPQSDDGEWVCQITYSVAGYMALASLWDHNEDRSSISIQHFKSRITHVFDAYESIFPEIGFELPRDKTDLIEDIYSIYLRNGYLYHSAYQISPAIPSVSRYGDLVFPRGSSPDSKLFMSGLGFYAAQETTTDRAVASMLGLQEQTFENYLEELLEHSDWEPIDWPDNTEYLRLDPPFSRGYWQQIPNKDNRISLARYGEPNKMFVFYRYQDGLYQQKTIPEWRIRNAFPNDAGGYGEYRRIAIALLKRYNTLPVIKANINGTLVEIKLGYRLPPSEEDFFKLYSWPVRYDFSSQSPQVFTRKMAKQVYPMFKHNLESIGYCFVEE